jgi:hypothetical protein
MTNHTPASDQIRPLTDDEIEKVSGGGIHLHVTGVFHFAAGSGGVSIGLFGVGVGVGKDGFFTFGFN